MCLDADTRLGHDEVFNEIARCFLSDSKVGLVGGNDMPSEPRNFFESIVVTWFNHWISMNRPVNSYVNPENSHGCLYAVSRKLANKIDIPKSVVADDLYVFWINLEFGFKFVFCKNADLFIKVPSNFSDFMSQSVRFGKGGKSVLSLFDEKTLSVFRITKAERIMSYFRSLASHPFRVPLAVILQILVKIQAYLTNKTYLGGVYETVKSSK